MIVLFWDIDGTLLTTGKAGVPAWEKAVNEVVGHDFELSKFRIAGLTDYQIAVRTFEMLGVNVDDDTIRYSSGSFTADLTVDKDGFVVTYPGYASLVS